MSPRQQRHPILRLQTRPPRVIPHIPKHVAMGLQNPLRFTCRSRGVEYPAWACTVHLPRRNGGRTRFTNAIRIQHLHPLPRHRHRQGVVGCVRHHHLHSSLRQQALSLFLQRLPIQGQYKFPRFQNPQPRHHVTGVMLRQQSHRFHPAAQRFMHRVRHAIRQSVHFPIRPLLPPPSPAAPPAPDTKPPPPQEPSGGSPFQSCRHLVPLAMLASSPRSRSINQPPHKLPASACRIPGFPLRAPVAA